MTLTPSGPSIEIADHIRRLIPYSPGRPIEEVQREHGLTDIIKLASNENPLGPSPAAVSAIQKASSQVGLYPDASCFELRTALARRLSVEPSMLVMGNGSDEIIHFLGLAVLQPGDEIIQASPTFVRYEAAAIMGQCECLSVPLRNHTHDLEAMADRFTERTRLVFISNPNNPTGTMNTRSELETLLSRLPARALLVLDEAYFEYVDHPDYPDSLEYVRGGANVIVLRTFSKIYGLAGLRVGYGVARPDLIGFVNQVREPFNVNLLAQVGALASLADDSQVERSLTVNRAGMKFLEESFRKMGLEFIPSVANFLMVDVRRSSLEVCADLERRGVIVRAGAAFGMPTYLRVTVGTMPQCERFVQTLREILIR
ncbi:MAG: histidinol-phosphate transaminase [Chloroflexi bacterium]|nr:histidinol-phosphate transaminase [Chloroflexota bacterium]